ncbi:ParA family protein [Mycobacteroides abscessus]|uniref:Cobyrinic acid a,c-diamide synthase n=1 Tax=Mycobacteroides abscessus TaxID=36809 RepID=A0A0U0ZRD9_9MYCO|nr:ParA family protein [Mycobacteroides abscessus]CPV67001.1 cobyrinic acid a%2Cc-diamide synthase [Mycobacteroides abscessus]
MSIYAIANYAGSAGKTTTATSLAVLLAAEYGLRVRLYDLDSQANASTWLGWSDPEDYPTISDVLNPAIDAHIADAERPARAPWDIDDNRPVYEDDSVIENLTIVPARGYALDELMPRLHTPTGVGRLRKKIREAPAVDVTILDAAGSGTALTLASILATSAFPDQLESSGVITCTLAQPKEVEGIAKLENEISGINDAYDLSVGLRGIVVCSVPSKGKVYANNRDDLDSRYGDLVSPSVRHRTTVPEAYGLFTPLPIYAERASNRHSRAGAQDVTDDYRKVLEHFIGNGLFPEAARKDPALIRAIGAAR